MSGKAKLLAKLLAKPTPKDFTKQQLDSLMSKCGCVKMSGGRGSSIKYIYRINEHTTRKLIFDEPHPGNNLYSYQIEKVIEAFNAAGLSYNEMESYGGYLIFNGDSSIYTFDSWEEASEGRAGRTEWR